MTEGSTRRIDPRLYLIVDPSQIDTVEAALRGGVTLLQLRAKTASTREFLQAARRLKARCGSAPLLINDRIDVALAAGAAGVHIGQDDMPVAEARQLLGPQAVIGLTVRSLAEAAAAPLEMLDYLSIGGVFATRSKDNPAPPIGLKGLCEIAGFLRARCALPLCAIAGIDQDNAGAVIAAGVNGVAVVSAVCAAADPEQAARALRRAIDRTQSP